MDYTMRRRRGRRKWMGGVTHLVRREYVVQVGRL